MRQRAVGARPGGGDREPSLPEESLVPVPRLPVPLLPIP